MLKAPDGDGGGRGRAMRAEGAAGGGAGSRVMCGTFVTQTYRSTQLLHTLQCEQRGGR